MQCGVGTCIGTTDMSRVLRRCRMLQDLLHLLSARRLPRPVWLGLTSDTVVTSRQRQRLAELFVTELTSLIAELDTKEHNWSVSCGAGVPWCYRLCVGRTAQWTRINGTCRLLSCIVLFLFYETGRDKT